MRVPIGERVRDAHLNHFCPGGASFPVTDSRPIGLGPEQTARPEQVPATAAARAEGQRCGRCGRPITPGQDARRRAGDAGIAGSAGGAWVHESCPPA